MPHYQRKSTLSRESSSSSSKSSRSSPNRRHSHEASRTSGSSRHHTREREGRHRDNIKEGSSGAGDGVGVGKRIYKTVEKLENPVKKLGKFVLWGAPLILAGLEVRHEWHHHAHKRRMMDKEYEKAHLEIQLQRGIDGKKEGITIEGTKSHGPTREKEETSEPMSDEVHILPYPAQVYHRVGRPSQHPSWRDTEACHHYLLPPHVPEVPCLDMCEDRQSRIQVKRPGSRDVLFPRIRSTSESVYEYRRW